MSNSRYLAINNTLARDVLFGLALFTRESQDILEQHYDEKIRIHAMEQLAKMQDPQAIATILNDSKFSNRGSLIRQLPVGYIVQNSSSLRDLVPDFNEKLSQIFREIYPEVTLGFPVGEIILTTSEFVDFIQKDLRFRIPQYFEDYMSMLRILIKQDLAFSSNYDIDAQQRERFSYEQIERTSDTELLDPNRGGLSGHLAMHQIKDSQQLLEAIVTSGYLLPANVLTQVNDNNAFDQLLKEGKVKSLIGTSFVHFSIDNPIGYLSTPYAFVTPVEVLLENKSFLEDPMTTNDWGVGGFTKNAEDQSNQIPLNVGILLIPESKKGEFSALLEKVSSTYPGVQIPNKIFYYKGEAAADGLNQLKELMARKGLGEPRRIAMSEKPSSFRELNSNDGYKADAIGHNAVKVMAVNPRAKTANGVIKYRPLPFLTRFNIEAEEVDTQWGKLTTVNAFSRGIESLANDIITTMGGVKLKKGRAVKDTGSSVRGTYQERFRGFPDDFDLMAYVQGDLPSKDWLASFQKNFAEALQANDQLPKVFGDDVVCRVEPSSAIRYEPQDGNALVSIKFFKGSEQNVPLLTIDVNFYNNEVNDDGPRYQETFTKDMDQILSSSLSPAEKEEGRQVILSTVRTLKALFKNEGVYKRWEGGLRGVGTEQLVMQLGGFDEKGNLIPTTSLDAIKKIYSMDSVMRRLLEIGFQNGQFVNSEKGKEILKLRDRGALKDVNLANGLSENTWRRLLILALDAQENTDMAMSSTQKDSAMVNRVDKGGIDLTSDKALEVQNSGEAIKFKIDPAMLAQLQNAPGFYPVIMNIAPLDNLNQFLEVDPLNHPS